jgi:hypothetical protein
LFCHLARDPSTFGELRVAKFPLRLGNDDLLKALASTVPLSFTQAEEIAELRAWAQDRAVWAWPDELSPQNLVILSAAT